MLQQPDLRYCSNLSGDSDSMVFWQRMQPPRRQETYQEKTTKKGYEEVNVEPELYKSTPNRLRNPGWVLFCHVLRGIMICRHDVSVPVRGNGECCLILSSHVFFSRIKVFESPAMVLSTVS